MKIFYLLSLVAFIMGSAGCQSTKVSAPHAGAIPSRIDDTLSPGDALRITFTGAPELSQAQRIRPDGKISLPKIGEVQAAGRKPSLLQEELAARYAKSLLNSEITVTVESSTFPVFVLGAVNSPGEKNLDRPSLLHAIGRAGGVVRGLGDASRIRIIHEGEKASAARVVNLKAVLEGKSDAVFYLQRGDTVIVPEKWL